MFKYILCSFAIYLISLSANAKLIQILHTNDIHSYIDSYSKDSAMGGYAAIKHTADKLLTGPQWWCYDT